METVDWSHTTEIAPGDLPAAITTYLVAHQRRDLDVALEYYTDSSTVTDEGHTYTGPRQIRDWLARAAGEYTYTTELVAASKVDDRHYDAVHHLAGDFPGGVVDLHLRFSLSDGKIAALVIEV